ncbi:hypothetical protein JHK82_043726 [Glycine max]|nr:hypothetical protein JHK87_043518 [Glycine soja]KAG4950363.1 hypothetical protein JHK86_043602 [Glycine max]KAG4957892.1 hypothetical protein JHK85_044272 [Glycine max]KAG5106756.1 hypothetical protein JHK82_043726 [Glycine max]
MIQCHNTKERNTTVEWGNPEVVPSHAKKLFKWLIGKMRMLFTGNSSAWEANKFYQ